MPVLFKQERNVVVNAPHMDPLVINQYPVRLGQEHDFLLVRRHHLELENAVVRPRRHSRLQMLVKSGVIKTPAG